MTNQIEEKIKEEIAQRGWLGAALTIAFSLLSLMKARAMFSLKK